MENYKFIARDGAGRRREGVHPGVSHIEVLTWLRSQDLTPVSVSRAGGAGAAKPIFGKGVKSADMSNFCWQLTTMIEGGVPVTAAVDTISEDMENPVLRHILAEISDKMRRGETLGDCVSQYPKIFNQIFCAMLMAGEAGGSLPQTLHRLAQYYDNRDKLQRKIKGAMAYPVFVMSFIGLIVIAIMTFIIPRFKMIFKQIGGELPAFTKAYMGIYDLIVNNVIFVIVGVAAAIIGLVFYSRTPSGRVFFSKLVLKIPLIGKILSQSFVAVFCRTLSTLLAAGVPVLEALNIVAGLSNNTVIRDAVLSTRERIIEGQSISASMASAQFFPNLAVKMTQVGEQSGSLPSVLDRVADYFERRIDSLISTLTALMEPTMIIIVGAIVCVTVLALYLPIFNISDIKK